MKHGFILIHKPVGPTSHDMVFRLRRQLSEPKIGHLGTLDPLASGLLVLAVGAKALKAIDLFTDLTKEYIADVMLGATSTTFDREGMITQTTLKPGWTIPEDSSRIQVLIADRFVGKLRQAPPQYSAISIGGERAYDLARQGKNVDMPLRDVQIAECQILSYAWPHLELRVSCSSGTYIRSLAHDIGAGMRCGGYLHALSRTKVGEWRLKNSKKLEDIVWSDVIPMKEVLASFPKIELSAENWGHIRNGRTIEGQQQEKLIAWFEDLPVAILEQDKKNRGRLKARKVF